MTVDSRVGVLGVLVAAGICVIGVLFPKGASGHDGHSFDRHLTIQQIERELASNVDGIKTAQIAYDAAFDTYIEQSRPVPVGLKELSSHAHDWRSGTMFDTLGWGPDSKVVGTYWVNRRGTRDFVVHGVANPDGDDKYIHFTATKSINTRRATPYPTVVLKAKKAKKAASPPVVKAAKRASPVEPDTTMTDLGRFVVPLKGTTDGRSLLMDLHAETSQETALAVQRMRGQLRDSVIALVADYGYPDLEGLDGKLELKDLVHTRFNQILTPHRIQRLYFSHFVFEPPTLPPPAMPTTRSDPLVAGSTKMVDVGRFVVNLNGLQGRQMLDLAIQIEISHELDSEELTRIQLRDSAILIAGDWSAEELESIDGKISLRDELQARFNQVLAPHGVMRVYFTQFVVRPSTALKNQAPSPPAARAAPAPPPAYNWVPEGAEVPVPRVAKAPKVAKVAVRKVAKAARPRVSKGSKAATQVSMLSRAQAPSLLGTRLQCSFTEPFLTLDYHSATGRTVLTNDGVGSRELLSTDAKAYRYVHNSGPRRYVIYPRPHGSLRLVRDHKGSNGMGPDRYTFSAIWDSKSWGKLHGGCEPM